MLLGCIADDFTGASDLANTLAKGGMATVQFVGIPAGDADRDCEAGVVALKTRSIPAQDARAEAGLLPSSAGRQSATAIGEGLAAEAARDHRLVVVEAVADEDLIAIGTAAADDKLITGGSGIAMGLPDNFRRAGLLSGRKAA